MAGAPDPCSLIGMVQTVYCYNFTAHSASWTLDPEAYPFNDRPQRILDTIQPLAPVTWALVPLALASPFLMPRRRRRLPHREELFAPDGSPVYPKVTGSQAAHCFWCYTNAHTCRPIAWLLPAGALPSLSAQHAARSDSSCPPHASDSLSGNGPGDSSVGRPNPLLTPRAPLSQLGAVRALPPHDPDPAVEAQDPIDLVSESSEESQRL